MRSTSESAEQQIAIKELEIEVLRRAILKKHKDLERISNAKASKVKRTDDHLRVMKRNPYLPVEVALRVFELLYHPDSVDFSIRSVLDLPLYRMSGGFTDLPGWQKAIQSQIPLVLVSGSRDWDTVVARRLSPRNELELGHHPRLRELGAGAALAQVGPREPAAACISVDIPAFEGHLAAARNFKLQSLILCSESSNFQRLFTALNTCGEFLWCIQSLEILFDRQPALYSQGLPGEEQDAREPVHLSLPAGVVKPALRYACLPWDTLRGCLPLLAHLVSLDLVISAKSFNAKDILDSFHLLPQSLTHFTLRHGFRTDGPPPPEDAINAASFPNLVELTINGFESHTTNVFLKGIDSPNLQSLVAKPVRSTSDELFHLQALHYKPSSLGKEGNIQFDFLAIAHRKFTRLRRLTFVPPVSTVRTAFFFCVPHFLTPREIQQLGPYTPFLQHLTKPVPIDGEPEWLLPTLEALDIQYDHDWENVLDLVTSLASARLRSDDNVCCAALGSVTLTSPDHHGARRGIIKRDVWRETQLNALRVLVPNVTFSGLGKQA